MEALKICSIKLEPGKGDKKLRLLQLQIQTLGFLHCTSNLEKLPPVASMICEDYSFDKLMGNNKDQWRNESKISIDKSVD